MPSSFTALGVQPEIVRGLAELGFTAPTTVQEKVVPALLGGAGDWICLAQTGTGKTAAFGIPLLQRLDAESRRTQALVLCPTRELCIQVARDLSGFARFLPALTTLAVYGGARIDQQINALKKGAQIIIATPGRLHDLLRRRAADLSVIGTLVLDEADEMLNMGFQEELNAILAQTPATRNTLLFSATMSSEVAAIASNYMTKPREITIGRRNSGAENVRHYYYMVRARDRYPALKRIIDLHPEIYTIIFCRTRQETQEVADKLMGDGFRAEALHGELSQSQRDGVMAKFRSRHVRILVATDVAARGMDVADLTHVINYNLPDEIAGYTHRSGRTGRAGKAGIAISIIHQRESGKIRAIEKNLKKVFERRQVPSGRQICEQQLLNRVDAWLAAEIAPGRLDALLPAVRERLAGLDREELLRRCVAVEFKGLLDAYQDAPDLNVQEAAKDGGRQAPLRGAMTRVAAKRQTRGRDAAQFTRFHVNIGKKDGVAPAQLISIINAGTRNLNVAIGRIELLRNFSFLEADSRFSSQILQAFSHQRINGRPVSIEIAAGSGKKYPAREAGDWEGGGRAAQSAKPRKNKKRPDRN